MTRRAPDFYLGDRTGTGDAHVVDFDGRIRTCFVEDRLTPTDRSGLSRRSHFLLVTVDPPLTIDSSPTDRVVLSERYKGDDLTRLDYRPTIEGKSTFVCVFRILDPAGIRHGTFTPTSLRLWAIGEVAPTPDRLLPTPEELFEQNFRVLQRFVEREGHANVPEGHSEDGIPIWNWVANLRYSQANGLLHEDEAARLNALPGWRWLPGDDYFLIERYARREGHTDVPPDYRDGGRPLGEFIRMQRERYRKGSISDQERERLERVPHWHW